MSQLILVVDDEASLVSVVRGYLEQAGYGVVTASNGREALFVAREQQPDLIILDLMMPYGTGAQELDANSDRDEVDTGVQLLRHLREREKAEENHYSSSPLWVAVITARNNPHLIQKLEQLLNGRGRIYLKPFTDFELEHDLAHVLGIDSKVPPALLPDGYVLPKLTNGGTG